MNFSSFYKAMCFIPLLFLSVQMLAQTNFTGKVSGSNNQPLSGVTITEKGTANASVSKEDGSFSIRLTSSNPVIILSSVGFTEKEVVVGTRSTINVTLEVESKQLNDVVVVGYGTQRKKDLTG